MISIAGDDDGKIQMDEIYSRIDAYSDKISGAVVFVELSGIRKTLISLSEIEAYVQSKGAVVSRVGDKRELEREDTETADRIVFYDPDEIVASELQKLNLTEAGLLLDGIIRDSETAKTNLTEVSELRLKEYLSSLDFQNEYRRESVYLTAPLLKEPAGETEPATDSELSLAEPFAEKTENQSRQLRQYTLGDLFGTEDAE